MVDRHPLGGYISIDNHVFKLYIEEGSDRSSKPLDPTIAIRELKTYPGKELSGDPTVESHDYLSTWGLSDLSGGLGVAYHRAGQTDERYRRATADVSNPGAWTTVRKINYSVAGAGIPVLLGTLWDGSALRLFAAYGTDIFEFDESTLTWTDTTHDLGHVSTRNEATSFEGTGSKKLLIPKGANGYSTYDGTTVNDYAPNPGVQPAAIDFCVLGNTKVYCIDVDGVFWESIDGTSWTPIAGIRIDGSMVPRGVMEHRDLNGDAVIYAHTTGGLYILDVDGPYLHYSGLRFPQHPTMGRSAEVFEGLYHITDGIGVRQFNGTDDRPIGLDLDDGIDGAHFDSSIVSLKASRNDMFALLHGYNPDGSDRGQLYRWDGNAWFEVWAEDTMSPHNLVVSGAGGGYRVHWAAAGRLYNMQLDIGDRNPRRVLLGLDEGAFEPEGHLWTGFWDAGLPGSDKVAVSVAARLTWIGSESLTPGPPQVGYRLNEASSSFTLLGSPFLIVDALDLGPDPPVYPASGPVADKTYYWRTLPSRAGLHFEEIEWRLKLNAGMVVKWFAMYYIRQMAGSFGWTISLDMTGPVSGRSPEQQRDALEALFERGSVYPVEYNGRTFYAAFSTWEGIEFTGRDDDRSIATVTLFEVRERP